jgi:hypothetical protein
VTDNNFEERSNYENIREGTLSQSGLIYPTAFLTATRAREPLERQRVKEKNRRKRMDDAVRRLQKVINAGPKQRQSSSASASSEATTYTPEDVRDAEGERASNAASKAAIVEEAVEYILRLQSQVALLRPDASNARDGPEEGG